MLWPTLSVLLVLTLVVRVLAVCEGGLMDINMTIRGEHWGVSDGVVYLLRKVVEGTFFKSEKSCRTLFACIECEEKWDDTSEATAYKSREVERGPVTRRVSKSIEKSSVLLKSTVEGSVVKFGLNSVFWESKKPRLVYSGLIRYVSLQCKKKEGNGRFNTHSARGALTPIPHDEIPPCADPSLHKPTLGWEMCSDTRHTDVECTVPWTGRSGLGSCCSTSRRRLMVWLW